MTGKLTITEARWLLGQVRVTAVTADGPVETGTLTDPAFVAAIRAAASEVREVTLHAGGQVVAVARVEADGRLYIVPDPAAAVELDGGLFTVQVARLMLAADLDGVMVDTDEGALRMGARLIEMRFERERRVRHGGLAATGGG